MICRENNFVNTNVIYYVYSGVVQTCVDDIFVVKIRFEILWHIDDFHLGIEL